MVLRCTADAHGAQPRRRSRAVAAAPPQLASARTGAFLDLTGQWVSVINEDWRWRMVTPPGGYGERVRSTRPVARWRMRGTWPADRARGDMCKAFGPPGLIRQPGRIRIGWENDNTLLLEFDAGLADAALPVRGISGAGHAVSPGTLHGAMVPPAAEPGHLRARGRGARRLARGVTTNLTAGYLRPNGVPYSERAVVKEFFDSFTLPDEDGTWLIVTTVVDDPGT